MKEEIFNKEEVIIRKAEANDLNILLQFEQGVVEAERPFDVTLKREATKYYDLDMMMSATHIQLLVAVFRNQLIASGYARIEIAKPYLQHQQHAYLGFMYVLPRFRGKEINQMIMKELKIWSLQKGITELRLDVYKENISAIRAYEKIGFVQHMVQMRMGIMNERNEK